MTSFCAKFSMLYSKSFMRDIQKIIHEYASRNIIQYEWGQNTTSIFNSIAKIWNKINMGETIAVSSYKKFGIKSAVKFLEKNGLHPKIVGKGRDNQRLIEIVKDSDRILEVITSSETIEFNFRDRIYKVAVGSAVFSKADLDEGTKFLLETVLDSKIDLNDEKVADLGSGWGAISLILSIEFPRIQLTAFEKDSASVGTSLVNLSQFKNVTVIETDLINSNSVNIDKHIGTFDYVISNPPFHARKEDRESIFNYAKNLLKPGGEIFFVTEGHFVDRFRKTAAELFSIKEEMKKDLWVVFQCRKL